MHMGVAPCEEPESGATPIKRAREVLFASLQLGLTSFGGPVAHLA
jgi:hypothetical protein